MALWPVVLFALVGGAAAQSYCSFFGNRAPSPQPSLTNCTWYRDSSCCLQEEINVLFPRVSPPTGANKRCRNFVNYLMCYVCSPAQNSFYASERLTVCADFCQDFYVACGDARLTGKRIRDLFTNGRQFCEDRQYIVDATPQSETCFNLPASQRTLSDSAGRASVTWSVVQLCTLLGLVFNFAPGSRWSAGVVLVLGVWFLSGGEAVFDDSTILKMASDMETQLNSLTSSSLKRSELQTLYDNSTIIQRELNATVILGNIKSKLEAITGELAAAASQIQSEARQTYRNFRPGTSQSLSDLPASVYQDADFAPWRLQVNFEYNG